MSYIYRIIGIVAILSAVSNCSKVGSQEAMSKKCLPKQTDAAYECLSNLEKDLESVILGNSNNAWNKICSPNYFHQCRQIIPEQFSNCFSQTEVDYIMKTVNAEIDGGIGYLCSDRSRVQEVLSNGGQLCLKSNQESIKMCGFELGYYPVDTQYSEAYCRQQDNMVTCTVNILKDKCSTNDISTIMRQYFESIIRASPCEPVSTFSGVHQVSTTVALLSPAFFFLMHKVLRIF